MEDGSGPDERGCLLEAKGISKSFGGNSTGSPVVEVVSGFSLRLEPGKLVTMFGPNGCGKTTILNILAGILEPDSGEVIVQSRDPDSLPIGYVFQNHADSLLPWRTVQDNIAFPLEIRRLPLADQDARVHRRMDQFRLTEHAGKYVYELSGGLKQLVAIARATVYDPKLLILDEPFSALDYSLSRMLWIRFREFWANQNVTTIFVSHNIDEAVFLGDRVIVLSACPAKVVADIGVPFGHERSLALLSSTEFFSTRNRVLQAFEEGRRG
jgi:NitT/TauT family transport system ATP-binding protein